MSEREKEQSQTPTSCPGYVDSEGYARFLNAIGHRVVSTDSAHWYDVNRLFYLSAPPNRVYDPDEEELRTVMRRGPCLGVRFAAPLHAVGKPSYQIVCDNRTYDLSDLSANVRSKVRRGLKRCQVQQVPFAIVEKEGRRAHQDTLARQGRDGILSEKGWRQFWAAAAVTPGIEVWGAWRDATLAAFLVTMTFEDSVEFLLARSQSGELGAYPNNALVFHVTGEMLRRRQVPEITFGLESLEPVGPLDEFKFGMGFRPRPLRQRVVFHPLLRALLRRGTVRRWLRSWTDRHGAKAVFWRKALGLLRFAEEGGL